MITSDCKEAWQCLKFCPTPPDPLAGVKGQIFKSRNNSVSFQLVLLKFRQSYN